MPFSVWTAAYPCADDLAKVDGFLIVALPFTCASVLLDEALGLGKRQAEDALPWDVSLAAGDVFALSVGVEPGREAVDLTEPVVTRAASASKASAIELRH